MSKDLTTFPLDTARHRLLAALLLALTLTACGGGGSDQSSVPAEQVTPDSTGADGGETSADAEQSGDQLVNVSPDDSSSAEGGQAAPSDQSSSVTGPSMPGDGADTAPPLADETTQQPVADSGANDPTSPVSGSDDQASPGADGQPQQPTDVDEDVPAAGEVVAGEVDDVDQLFEDDDEQTPSVDEGESSVVVDDASSDGGEELVTDSGDLPLLDDESQPATTDGALSEDALIAEQQPVTEAIGDLFGDGGEVVAAQAVSQNHSAPRELRWTLPSERMNGSALGRQEVKAIELWGGLAHQPLRKWATLAPTAQYYGLAQVPQGIYRFAMVTIDQDGLRSEMSAAVIRDLR